MFHCFAEPIRRCVTFAPFLWFSVSGTISVFNGEPPEIYCYDDTEAEIDGVSEILLRVLSEGIVPGEVAIFVRSEAQMPHARATFKQAGVKWTELERISWPPPSKISRSTMHCGVEYTKFIASPDATKCKGNAHQRANDFNGAFG